MTELSININENRTAFLLGEEIGGNVSWDLETSPLRLELRLFWYTRGKGTVDFSVVNTVGFENLGAKGNRDFIFPVPKGPFSFSGTLISLVWALEFLDPASDLVARTEIVISPSGKEIHLSK